MRRQHQNIAPRERDLSTDTQLGSSVGLSVVVHLLFVALVMMVSSYAAPPKLMTPGYKVKIIDLTQLQKLTAEKPTKKVEQKKKPPPKKPKKKVVSKKVKSSKKVVKKLKTIKKKRNIKKKVVPKKARPKPLAEVVPEPIAKPVKAIRPLPDLEPVETVPVVVAPAAVLAAGVEFPYNWYLTIIERKVQDAWVTHGVSTLSARRDPTVVFVVRRNGAIESRSLDTSSGSDELDATALDAVDAAGPFPPLPEEYPEETLLVHFSFSYVQK